jgi:uncharacterized protein involved in tolerance to divalent cations
LFLGKTASAQVAQLQAAFKKLHPYELRECMELVVDGASEEYPHLPRRNVRVVSDLCVHR